MLHCHRKESQDGTVIILSMAVDSDLNNVLRAIVDVLTQRMRANVLHGAAPATGLEREVQRVIDKLQKKAKE